MIVTLLIVDDDEYFRSKTQKILEECGYSVEIASYSTRFEIAEDGLVGWDLIDQSPAGFDLILLEKQMLTVPI